MKNVRSFRPRHEQLSAPELAQHIAVAYASLSEALEIASIASGDYAYGNGPRYTLTPSSNESDRNRGIGTLYDARYDRSYDIRVAFGTSHEGVTLRREFFEDVPDTDCMVKVKTNSKGPLFRELMNFIRDLNAVGDGNRLVYATA